MMRYLPLARACGLLALAALAAPLAAAPRFDDQRLFTTAEQRARLDELRTQAEQTETGAGSGNTAPQTAAPPPKKPPRIEVRGFIKRSKGPAAVWVNGGSTLPGDRVDDDIRIDSGRIDGSTVVVTLPDGRTVRLKPGQVWDPDTGHAVDAYRSR